MKMSVMSEADVRTGRETLGSLVGEEGEGEVMGKRLEKRRFKMLPRVAHTPVDQVA